MFRINGRKGKHFQKVAVLTAIGKYGKIKNNSILHIICKLLMIIAIFSEISNN